MENPSYSDKLDPASVVGGILLGAALVGVPSCKVVELRTAQIRGLIDKTEALVIETLEFKKRVDQEKEKAVMYAVEREKADFQRSILSSSPCDGGQEKILAEAAKKAQELEPKVQEGMRKVCAEEFDNDPSSQFHCPPALFAGGVFDDLESASTFCIPSNIASVLELEGEAKEGNWIGVTFAYPGDEDFPQGAIAFRSDLLDSRDPCELVTTFIHEEIAHGRLGGEHITFSNGARALTYDWMDALDEQIMKACH